MRSVKKMTKSFGKKDAKSLLKDESEKKLYSSDLQIIPKGRGHNLAVHPPFVVQLGPNLCCGFGPKVNTKLTLEPPPPTTTTTTHRKLLQGF